MFGGYSTASSTPERPSYGFGAFGNSTSRNSVFGASTTQSPASDTPNSAPVPKTDTAPKGRVAGFLAALNDDTDLTIILDGHTWRVHSDLMISNSPFFEVLCNGQWKESKARVVEIHDDRIKGFARFLQFIYCCDYEGNDVQPFCTEIEQHLTLGKLVGIREDVTPGGLFHRPERRKGTTLEHLEVYELADKYGCQKLQDLARDNIGRDHSRNLLKDLNEILECGGFRKWRELIGKDEKLKEIFAQILASNYRRLKTASEAEPAIVNGWLGWLEEDKIFCAMVMDAMSKKF